MLRTAAVAGSWYPSAPARLRHAVEGHLRVADELAGPPHDQTGDLVALVSPHAGLVYSGPVAAHGYRLLRQRALDLIILVGPSHYVPFEGVSIWPRGAFETPVGAMTIDETAAQALVDRCPLVRALPQAHGREHSLEMQLPFLAVLAGDVPILPLVMGHQTRDTAFALGDALADIVRARRTLLVASSDLTHFLDARLAARLDAVVIQGVEELDADGLMTALEQRPDHACGGGPIVSVLRASALLGATRGEALRYADSGDVSGDKSSVVGYLSAAIWK
jgi:MEMO1 family protein